MITYHTCISYSHFSNKTIQISHDMKNKDIKQQKNELYPILIFKINQLVHVFNHFKNKKRFSTPQNAHAVT